jgi:hypothetical protein
MNADTPCQNPHGPATLPYEKRNSYIQYESEGCGEVRHPINWNHVYNLKGRLLTLIDATYTDPEQRKAQKDVVWATLRDWIEGIETEQGYPGGPPR